MRRLSILLVALLLGACSSSAPTSTAADEQIIRAATQTWNDAYNAGDVDRIIALYADDAVVMPPNQPPVVGLAALREYLTHDIVAARAAGLAAKDGKSEVGIAGDMAWHAGEALVVDRAGKTAGTDNYVEVWQRRGGRWLMVRDIWNDAAPTTAPASTPGTQP